MPEATLHMKMRPLHVTLFLLAAILIGRAAILQNDTPSRMNEYIQGHVRMPFQGRYLMVPVLRWAESGTALQRGSELLKQSSRGPVDLMMQLVDVLCLIAMGFVAVRLRNDLSPAMIFPWLAPGLLLWVVLCGYVARYESRFYQPYDFVAALIFAIGILACVESRPLLLIGMVLIGSYNRETAICLLPIWLACNFDKSRWRVWSCAAIALAAWIAVRLQMRRWFPGPLLGFELPWMLNIRMLLPHHLPQVLSVGGFLVIPMWLGRRMIHDKLLVRVWVGSLPFVIATLVFGWWNETRIFGELNVLFAVTAAVQFEQYLRENVDRARLPGSGA
jgi:hypothetical protein